MVFRHSEKKPPEGRCREIFVASEGPTPPFFDPGVHGIIDYLLGVMVHEFHSQLSSEEILVPMKLECVLATLQTDLILSEDS